MIKDGKLLASGAHPIVQPREELVQTALPLNTREDPAELPQNLSGEDGKVVKTNQLEENKSGKFMLSIQGDGINSTLVIDNKEDFDIIEALLAKIKRKLL